MMRVVIEFSSLPFKSYNSELWGDEEVGVVLPEDAHYTQTQGGGVVPHKAGLLVSQGLLYITQLLQQL